MPELFENPELALGKIASLNPDGDRSRRKLRGGYYTSYALAKWLCSWAMRSPSDRVLEPSCGDGAFLMAAVERFTHLGASQQAIGKQLTGVELSRTESETAVQKLLLIAGKRSGEIVHNGDFFSWFVRNRETPFDCVVGNPPFIRYQNFPEPSRSLAMGILKSLGLRPNKLMNTWVPFLACATAILAPGGRLAMVIPAELLQVSYAAQLRSFLADNFRSIDIMACNELFFDQAEQEVVLLLAGGRVEKPSASNQCRIDLCETETVEEVLLRTVEPDEFGRAAKVVEHDSEKWLKYFLSTREIAFMRETRRRDDVVGLRHHAEIDVGVVTGNNDFFVLSQDDVARFELADHVVPLVGRSRQLRGAILNGEEWRELAKAGERLYLFYVPRNGNSVLSPAGTRYVRAGESQEIHRGYKCSVREPWYFVPSVWSPDCFFFRQIYDFPRAVLNRARATSTDTVHRMKCGGRPEELLPNLYTHLVAASAEIEGRSYGGGVLELEPTEAERLLVPRELRPGLSAEETDSLVRAGRLEEVLRINDKRVLMEGLGFSSRDCGMLRAIWSKMRNRRFNRSRRKAKAG